jgi:hypothetical protein
VTSWRRIWVSRLEEDECCLDKLELEWKNEDLVTRVDFRWNVDNENPKKLQVSRWRIWCDESTSESHLLLGFEKNGRWITCASMKIIKNWVGCNYKCHFLNLKVLCPWGFEAFGWVRPVSIDARCRMHWKHIFLLIKKIRCTQFQCKKQRWKFITYVNFFIYLKNKQTKMKANVRIVYNIPMLKNNWKIWRILNFHLIF